MRWSVDYVDYISQSVETQWENEGIEAERKMDGQRHLKVWP